MPNLLDRQILEDGPRNAVVKFVGMLDSSDVTEVPALALGDMIGNDQNQTLAGFRVDRIDCTASFPLQVTLAWNSTNPQLIAAIGQDNAEMDFKFAGGLQPNMTLAGYDGGINLYTSGYPTLMGGIYNFTIRLRLVKVYTG